MNEINMDNKTMDDQIDEFRNASNQLVQQIVHIDNETEFKNYSTTVLDILDDMYRSVYLGLATRTTERRDFTHSINDNEVTKATMTIKDATITTMEPKLSLQNYLTIGKVYIMESRYNDAINSYEEGIRKLLPSEWPALYMKRQEAKETLNRKKLDFITRLPPEIVAYIFDYLAAIEKKKETSGSVDSTLVTCTTVSHGWRTILLEQDYVTKKLWKSASFSDSRELIMNSTAKLLSIVGKNVQKIKLLHVHEYVVKRVKELAYAGRLPSLKELTFLLHEECNCIISITQFVSLIANNCNNLMKLEIGIHFRRHHHDYTPLCLGTVLSTCPNLKELSIVSRDSDIFFNPIDISLDPNTTFSLTSLAIFFSHDATMSLLHTLIPYCPYLKTLVTSSRDTHVLNLVDQYCPKLERLYVHYPIDIYHLRQSIFQYIMNGSADSNSGNNCPAITTSSSLQTVKIKLRFLTPEYVDSLSSLLLKGQHTIQHIDMQFYLPSRATPGGFPYLWNTFINHPQWTPNGSFHQLTTLNIIYMHTHSVRQEAMGNDGNGGGGYINSIATFITQHCRSLESLSLLLFNAFPESFYISLATQLPKLSHFEIETPVRPSSHTGLQRFFEYHANLEYKSSLRTFTLRKRSQASIVKDALLSALGDTIALEKITLFGPFGKCTRKGIHNFLRKLVRGTSLREVVFHDVPYLEPNVINELETFSGFERVKSTLSESPHIVRLIRSWSE